MAILIVHTLVVWHVLDQLPMSAKPQGLDHPIDVPEPQALRRGDA